MNNLLTFLLIFASLSLRAQEHVNANTVMLEIDNYRKAGLLDSGQVDTQFFNNRFKQLESPKTFYFVRDTIKLKDGVFAVGNFILDPFLEFNKRLFGQWQWFFLNGTLMAKGDYSLISYVSCSAGGPQVRAYNMPTGKWYLFHSNAKPMVFCDFELEKYEMKTSCGLYTFVRSHFVKQSNCLDKDGNSVERDNELSVILNLIQELR